ncbi:MAG: Hpt domain-containing protein [Anaerolineae bacterium]
MNQESPISYIEYSTSNHQYFDRAQHRSPIDPAALEEFRAVMGEDGAELVAELIDTFVEDASRLLADMREAVAREDADALERAAHGLKGSSATLAALGLSDLCQELEDMGRAGTLEGAVEIVAQVETEYEKVKVALEAMRT